MLSRKTNILIFISASVCLCAWFSSAKPGNSNWHSFHEQKLAPSDTGKEEKNKKRPNYTPSDRQGDPFSNKESKSPLILQNPSIIKTEVELDSSMEQYNIYEKIGDMDYRTPSSMTFDEYSKIKNRQMMNNYWRSKSQGLDGESPVSSRNNLIPKIFIKGLEGPFGSNFVDIRPNGLVTLDFGGKWQRVNNPNIPVRQQRNGGFDFDQQITMNVVGKIGEKLKLTANWDTKATFDFQNNLKLEYTGYEEDIIQKIEAGQVNFPVNSTLYSGAQNLFGIKTKLQFGRLSVTSVFSSQRGKSEEIRVQGGAQAREFEIRADDYEYLRHFLLGQFFVQNYEPALSKLPAVNSGVKITRVDVYVTNRTNKTTDLVNIVPLMDLGESGPFRPQLASPGKKDSLPTSNEQNRLYEQIKDTRTTFAIEGKLESMNLEKGTDFEIIKSARKLERDKEFKFHPDLGYITLNTQIKEDEALAVAYEYSYEGKTYKVGELTEDFQGKVPTGDSVIIVKMLKPSSIKTRQPTWRLMMKNIYQLGANQISRSNFLFKVIYRNDSTGLDLPIFQEGSRANRKMIMSLVGLDRLNMNNDPQPDGNFDYIEDVTIDSKYGRVIFPVLEPFGSHLAKTFDGELFLENKYVFSELYDSTKFDAKLIASKNKYFFKGRYQSAATNEIILPGINIAPGSVIVTAGSTPLIEGIDYTIDYNLGRLKIINEGVLASNKEVKVRFEKQDIFNFRRKAFMGTRFDFVANKNFIIGGTVLHQNETPNITRVSIGDEPSRNTILGLDFNYKTDSRMLTKAVDLLPGIQTKAVSSVNAAGEVAGFFPGHSNAISKDGGTSYIDDFEGSRTSIDLTGQATKWRLGATPKRFPESNSTGTDYTAHRAKLAWYTIDQSIYNGQGVGSSIISPAERKNYFTRAYSPQDLFPGQDQFQVNLNLQVFDLAYFPAERGPYNFNTNITPFGTLQNPRRNWAAITRDIRNDIDFDNSNIQYIEFWMMDPFMPGEDGALPLLKDGPNKNVTEGGRLYLNLGSISEDVMKDKEHFFENGLPVNKNDATKFKETDWGRVPTGQFITNAFDTDPGTRSVQDVGLDGLNNSEEREFYKTFLDNIIPKMTAASQGAKDSIINDPSGDNFNYYIGKQNDGLSLVQRYKHYNGTENNSPIANIENGITPSNYTTPDNEDLNGDNTINDVEEYYEYKVSVNKQDFVVGKNHIVSSVNTSSGAVWYQFRIPIRMPDSIVGNINGFKSIKFMRMYVTGFPEPVILKFAKFQLVASQWRPYLDNDLDLPSSGAIPEPDNSTLNISTVNAEENGQSTGQTSPYVLPPGMIRDQDATAQNFRRLNEQSLRLCIDDLKDKNARATYKLVNLNMINYKNLRMFVHAETQDANTKDREMDLFLRLGTDFNANYYEVAIPLYFTQNLNSRDPYEVWRAENELNLVLQDLVDVKLERDRAGFNSTLLYESERAGRKITVRGRPDLTSVQAILLGLRNPDDGNRQPKSACVWVNELRATNFEQSPGYAATGRINMKLADLATVSTSIRYTTVGFGSLEQRISQRERNNTLEWGAQSNIALDRFLPTRYGIKLPLFVSYDRRSVSPQYAPLDPDVKLKDKLANFENESERNRYKLLSTDQTTRRSINFTNIQKVRTNPEAKTHFYDIENFTLSVGYSDARRTTNTTKDSTSRMYRAGLGYTYTSKLKPLEPFKNMKGMKSPYLKLIKDFNINPLPTSFTFRGDLNRNITKIEHYIDPMFDITQDPIYQKQFLFDRVYGMNWNMTKSLTFDYAATTNAVIDEPNNLQPGTREYNDSLWTNIKKLGRMKNYNQVVGANYKMPFDKLPLTDWLSSDLRYTGGYTWMAGALDQVDSLGNTIRNEQTMGLNGRVSLDKIYNKVKFLKEINNPAPQTKPGAKPPVQANKKDTTQTLPKPEYKALKAVLSGIMSLKTINFTYNLTRGTLLPGYMPNAQFIGLGSDNNGSGGFVDPSTMLPFIVGSQNPDIRHNAQDYLTTSQASRRVSTPFTQTRNENLTLRTNLEPIKDFKIQLDAQRTKGSDYKEFYRIDSTGTRFVSENPYRTGRYEISYITIQSSFDSRSNSFDKNSSKNFERFLENRETIVGKYQRDNPGDSSRLNSQDVMIPAFLSAYTKRDPDKVSKNPFPAIPLPNWRVDFSGLTKLEVVKKRFQSVIISHAYTSRYSVSSYTSSLKYGPDVITPGSDPTTNYPSAGMVDGQLTPVYVIEQVSIRETFAPLIGINVRTKGKFTYRAEYRKDRMLNLSMTNAQIQEMKKNDFVFSFGVIKSGFKLPFRWQGREIPPLKNELNLKMDITISDQTTVQRKVDRSNTVTAGNLSIQLMPNISYVVNQRLNLQFYFERTINQPKISSSFRRATTAFGVRFRFTLS
ncbi:MAG: cell surface protein SprA [Cytophagaceae bacterium]